MRTVIIVKKWYTPKSAKTWKTL